VEVSAADVERLCELFEDDFYVDRAVAARAVETQGVFNMIHTMLIVKVDVIIRKDNEYHRTEFSRRRRIAVEGRELFVAAPEDLIIAKLEWARASGSEVQLADVRNIAASTGDLDVGYLSTWTRRLGLAALYRQATS
jgi:hypothetical protein